MKASLSVRPAVPKYGRWTPAERTPSSGSPCRPRSARPQGHRGVRRRNPARRRGLRQGSRPQRFSGRCIRSGAAWPASPASVQTLSRWSPASSGRYSCDPTARACDKYSCKPQRSAYHRYDRSNRHQNCSQRRHTLPGVHQHDSTPETVLPVPASNVPVAISVVLPLAGAATTVPAATRPPPPPTWGSGVVKRRVVAAYSAYASVDLAGSGRVRLRRWRRTSSCAEHRSRMWRLQRRAGPRRPVGRRYSAP